MSKKSATTAAPVYTIVDVKGITLSTSETVDLATQIQEAEMQLTAACATDHKNVVDGYIAIGKGVLALRAIVDSNLANLGNFTSFKSWMADKKFGPRAIGYKQCTLYATIGKHPDVARELYNGGIWALSALATAVNEQTGNTKTGGRKVSEATTAEGEGTEAVTSEVTTGVTSLEAVLAFIAQADRETLQVIAAAGQRRIAELKGKGVK